MFFFFSISMIICYFVILVVWFDIHFHRLPNLYIVICSDSPLFLSLVRSVVILR